MGTCNHHRSNLKKRCKYLFLYFSSMLNCLDGKVRDSAKGSRVGRYFFYPSFQYLSENEFKHIQQTLVFDRNTRLTLVFVKAFHVAITYHSPKAKYAAMHLF